jgi:hypothetical protein
VQHPVAFLRPFAIRLATVSTWPAQYVTVSSVKPEAAAAKDIREVPSADAHQRRRRFARGLTGRGLALVYKGVDRPRYGNTVDLPRSRGR